jgi:thiol:disulfide interchange protein DsbG
MFSSRLYFSIALLLIAISLFMQTAVAGDSKPKHLPKALETLKNQQKFEVIKEFKTDAPGINGYVVQSKSSKIGIVYSYKDFVIFGALIDADGHNLSQKYAQEYIPKPDYAAGVKMLEQTGFIFSEGKKGAPEIYVFADPNCFFCHKFWKATRAWVNNGKIRIHWAMVGFLKKSSAGRAAAILASKDGAKALAKDEQKFDLKHEEGGIAELTPITEKYKQALSHHNNVMNKLHFTGTPAIVFKDTHGEWQGVNGMPPMAEFGNALGIK